MNCQISKGCFGKQYKTCNDTGRYAAGAAFHTNYACFSTDNFLDGNGCPKNVQTSQGTGCWTKGTVAAVAVAFMHVTGDKKAVQMAVCRLVRAILVAGKNIAQMEILLPWRY
jgi:hypothetical protein